MQIAAPRGAHNKHQPSVSSPVIVKQEVQLTQRCRLSHMTYHIENVDHAIR